MAGSEKRKVHHFGRFVLDRSDYLDRVRVRNEMKVLHVWVYQSMTFYFAFSV
jgi:hypothetical protein